MEKYMGRFIIAIVLVVGFIPAFVFAQAIKVNVAKVQNGVTVVSGTKAERNAPITWEGGDVTQTNNGGSFRFSGVVPSDCVGTLSDGEETIEVAVSGCEVSGLLATGQTMAFQANKNDGDGGTLDNVDDDGTLQIGVPLQYVENGDGTVTDLNTGLMWETKLARDGSDGGNCADGDQANRDLHCVLNVYRWSGDGSQETIWDWLDDVNAENYAGHNNWRIPNIKELRSIVDHGQSQPTADPIFAPINSETWSSTTPGFNATLAFVINFDDGFSKIPTKTTNAFRVRAVRGGL